MSWTIGRLGVTTVNGGDGETLAGPEGVDGGSAVVRAGDELTVTGSLDYGTYSTTALLTWQAEQLVGLNHGDEPVVPVTFSDAPRLDGFYRVTDVSLDYQMVGAGKGFVPYQIGLAAITDVHLSRVEYPTVYGLRGNAHSVTSYDLMAAVPGPTQDYTAPFTVDSSTSRPVAEGSAAVLVLDDGATAAGGTGVGRLIVAPASYYHAGCRVEYDVTGAGGFRQAVGRQSFAPSGTLRVGNGLARAVITYGTAAASKLEVQWWDGSQWDTATEFYLEGVSVHGELVYYSATILRNTAESCTVRFNVLPDTLATGATTVDVTVRRGSRWVMLYVQSVTEAQWRLGFSTSTACTSLTSGLRRTSNNAGGNREIIVGSDAATFDTTNGRVTSSLLIADPRRTTFAVGVELGGSGATGQNAAAAQLDEFFGVIDERGIVVAV